MASTKSENEMVFYGFELDVFKRQCKLIGWQSIQSVQSNQPYIYIPGAKYARLNCKQMIRSFVGSIIDGAQKECTVEMARKIRDLSKNYMQIIKVDLGELIRTFDEKVDKYLSIPAELTVHSTGAGEVAAVCDVKDSEENALNERIDELETVYKQQAILMQKLRAELEFYQTVMDEQAEIDDGLCLLVEKYIQDDVSEPNTDERILEHLNTVLEAENASLES